MINSSTEKEAIEMIVERTLKNTGLRLIEDPEKFKKDYSELINLKNNSFSDEFEMVDFGDYNIKEITKPYLDEKGFCIFYAKDTNQIPYKVIQRLFPSNQDQEIECKLLELVE